MGSSAAATGGGGSGVPDMIRPPKIRRKEKFQESIKNFKPPVVAILEGVGEAAKKSNLKRRKSFISKYNTNVPPSERIDLTDEQISSKEGLANLKDKGYTTASDTMNTGGGNDNNNQPAEPVIVKKNIGGTEVQTTEAKLAEEKEIDDAYDMRKTKRRGRRQTILTSQRGATGNLVLGKPTLLGT